MADAPNPVVPNPVTPNLGLRNLSRELLWQVPVALVGTALFQVTTGLGVRSSFGLSMLLLLLVLMLWTALALGRDFRARGRLLLDCGPSSSRWLSLATGSGLALLGAFRFLSEGSIDAAFLAANLWLLPAAILFTGFGFGRLQVVENGIWSFHGLVQWDEIRAYRWTPDSTLWIETSRRSGLFGPRRGAIAVPPEHAEFIEASLVRHGVLQGSEPDPSARILARRQVEA